MAGKLCLSTYHIRNIRTCKSTFFAVACPLRFNKRAKALTTERSYKSILLLRSGLGFLVCLIFEVVGCGPSNPITFPVQGRVEFDNGEASQIGSVEFRSLTGDERITARGKIEKDGSFTLSTFEPGDGALPGEHQVIVQQMVISEGLTVKDHQHGPRVPRKYSDYSYSGLKAHVLEAKQNPIVIKLETMPK